jgi:hypothetical protein
LFEATGKYAPSSKLATSLWSVIDSPNTPRETRFALSNILAATADSTFVGEGVLDQITLEATETALSTSAGVEVAVSAIKRSSE